MAKRSGNHLQPHLTPERAASGLASALNARFVERVLRCSDKHHIAHLLNVIGYAPASLVKPDLRPATDAEVRRHLARPDVRADVERRVQVSVAAHAKREVESAQGRQAINRMKAGLFAENVAADADLVRQSCRDAVAAKVAGWLNSPVGRESVEQAKARALKAAVDHDAPPAERKSSWLDEVKPYDDGSR